MASNKSYWEKRQNQRNTLPNLTPIKQDLLYRIASEVRTQLIDTIESGTRSGREYKRGDKIHIASAPGEPPVTDSGQLVNSISQPVKNGNNEYYIPITNEYAMYLELGSINMRPRPFIQRSMDKAIEELKKSGVLK